jgi:hypothetical protein
MEGSSEGFSEGESLGSLVGLKVGKGEGIGEGGLVGTADGVLSELVGLMLGWLVGVLVGAPVTGAPVGAEVVGVTSGQKPHDSGQLPPTSKLVSSSPRLQYNPVRLISVSSLELCNNHAQSTVAPLSVVKVDVELSAQVAAQDSQVAWQAHLTLPYSQYFRIRPKEFTLLFNHAQFCSLPLSRLNLNSASSPHAGAARV